MATLDAKLVERDAYLEKIGNQLEMLESEFDHLKAEVRHIKPDSRHAFHHKVQMVTDKLELVKKGYRDLSLASAERWKDLKATIDQKFTGLNLELQQTRELTETLKQESLSWAKGQASEHVVNTLGWAEGQASEDDVVSQGWAEGQAEDHDVESEGWAEGFAQPKEA